ncbi:hypothetical protein BJQ96_02273 [Flavobacterium sp. PL0002]|nr:hypothetical protein [Flavobacterium sp. PL002]
MNKRTDEITKIFLDELEMHLEDITSAKTDTYFKI